MCLIFVSAVLLNRRYKGAASDSLDSVGIRFYMDEIICSRL